MLSTAFSTYSGRNQRPPNFKLRARLILKLPARLKLIPPRGLNAITCYFEKKRAPFVVQVMKQY